MGLIRHLSDYLRLNYHFKHYTHKRLKRHQTKAVKNMVNYAMKHSPFYRDYYKGRSVKSIDDFHELPTIDKTRMMTHFSTLNTEGLDYDDVMQSALRMESEKDYLGYYKKRFVVGLSSGTSGNKGLFVTSKALTKRLPGVFLARGGLSIKALPFRIMFLLRVFSQGFQDINAPFIKLKYRSTMTAPETIIDTINKERMNVLMAPPSFLRFLLPLKASLHVPLKKIITYAEVLTADEKQQFQDAFNAPVVEIYQASEGQMASPCKYGHLHINEDLVYIELFDEQNNRIETPGVISYKTVITNLINKSQPLIRYVMNDMIVLDDDCPCGSKFRRIKKIIGRQDDLIYFLDEQKKNKVVFPDLFARWIITESDAIREFRVIQHRYGEAIIEVDLMKPYDLDTLKARINQALSALKLTGTITIRQNRLALSKTKNKFKRFIQHQKNR